MAEIRRCVAALLRSFQKARRDCVTTGARTSRRSSGWSEGRGGATLAGDSAIAVAWLLARKRFWGHTALNVLVHCRWSCRRS
jgi:hypothetical protein